jgi:cation transport regulator ChaB
MPRKAGKADIPSTIARSDRHAQEIYTKTHDSAVETYGEGEHAHRVAFASLKHSYKKVGDHWEQKSARGPSDEQAARGPTTAKKSTDPDTARTAGGRVAGEDRTKQDLLQEARRVGVIGRSRMNKEELAQALHKAKARRAS